MKLIEGQVAVVTGAASGIGLGMATLFASRGLKLALADIDEDRLNAVSDELAQGGAEVLARATNVADAADMQHFRDAVLERFGRVDILCNNAGIVSPFRPLWENPLPDWERVIGVNLWGIIHGIRLFVPGMVAAGRGHVVNTASMAGLIVVPWNGLYNAAKTATVSLSETLRADLEAAGSAIGVTVLCPGLVKTAINSDPTIAALIPPDAVFLEPADVARQVVSAIERDQLYLATHHGSDELVRTRQEQVLSQVRRVP
ncbi:SDR family NAD(P)-dependent oxidoreductase [Novosphingobium taihuense]|uniref:NADP-dependent 3-hydroxy acid dehydrogenase YdfG n=1 Tax=Novosphingobium taihuense TaxID=260085 RepID=A0A7W7AC50_9SPHN|nr:SDR family NAD(P)-dependent oxidoreductase [Novosphingobium taihuense]MBB4614308.1 NADP-dependent 3-hydroxy acid dehydrogenase YdfG [Novosphingobium taihuense]TWH87154.1 NADP-dependent 3-hydroxy acid dehydrogenase YdfG [Novosphingobium taihuense]